MKLKNFMTETSLSRVWIHMQEHDSGTITAFRDARDCGEGNPYSKGEKKAMNKVLLANLMSKGFSVTKIKGAYIENYGSKDAKEVGESSFLVVDIKDSGKLKKVLLEQGEKFEQDSILFIPKGGDTGQLIGTNKCPNGFPGYRKINKLKNPVFGKGGEFQTRVNGRPFILKEEIVTIPPVSSGMGHWASSVIGKNSWENHYEQNKELFESEEG